MTIDPTDVESLPMETRVELFNALIRDLMGNDDAPEEIAKSARTCYLLVRSFGQAESMRRCECIDYDGEPIPWYSYPATEYIRQLDFSGRSVFEFGSGNSTIFWSRLCRSLVAVEHNPEWHDIISPKLPDSVEYLLVPEGPEYEDAINRFEGDFDVIIVDGKRRFECAEQALGKLADDGLIILDNSDWHVHTAALLRDADLIEVDMSGFGPINATTWTTSFFFTRKARFDSAHERQPMHGIGAVERVVIPPRCADCD